MLRETSTPPVRRPALPVESWIAEYRRLIAGADPALHRRELLQVAVRGVQASGGALWQVGGERQLSLACQIGLGAERLDQVDAAWPGHRELLADVLEQSAGRTVTARFEPHPESDNAPASGAHSLTLLLQPLAANGDDAGVLELFLHAERLAVAPSVALEAVAEFCRSAATIHASIPDADPETTSRETLAGFAAFCDRIHQTLDADVAAVAIANAVRVWVGCDRATVAMQQGRQARIAAVSGLDSIDRRSRPLRALQALATAVNRAGVACWSRPKDDLVGFPELLRGHLEECRDAVPHEGLVLIPLPPPQQQTQSPQRGTQPDAPASEPVVGTLILEHFDPPVWNAALQQRTALAAQQTGLALQRIREHRQMPLFPLTRLLRALGWRSSGRRIRGGLCLLILLGSIVAALVLVPADLEIAGRGALQPQVRRDLFAPARGIVDEIAIEHGARVAAGQPLVTLRSPELEFEVTRIDGEIVTTQQQIADVDALRKAPAGSPEARQAGLELAAKLEELRSVLTNLQTQREVLARRESELALASPIPGDVLTMDVRELLEQRSVEPGQRLLSVADLRGAWVVEILVPDQDIGIVRRAVEISEKPLPVRFHMATDLSREYLGEIVDVASVVEEHPIDGPSVRVTVGIDSSRIQELHPGATVYPRIACGRRPVGYVWFRQFIDSVIAWFRF